MFGTWSNTIFRVSAGGSYTAIHTFNGNDGAPRLGPLTIDSGTLYGTASSTIYRVSGSGDGFKVLHTLNGQEGGDSANGRPAVDASGFVFGSASFGGLQGVNFGTIYRVAKNGSAFSVVHSFSGELDGGGPYGGLAVDASGRVVGTTGGRGEREGGTAFRVEANPPVLSIGPGTMPDGTSGVPYPSIQLTGSGGTAPYRFGQSGNAHLVGVPPGLVLSDDGVLSGVPWQPGNWQFAISLEDANGFVDSRGYSVRIAQGVNPLPPMSLPTDVNARSGSSQRIALEGSDPTHAATDFHFEILIEPQFGTISDFSVSAGTLNYTPAPGYIGHDFLQFDVRDEFGVSTASNVNIDVYSPRVRPVLPTAPIPVAGRR
jgi:uncharacterized repeat protein (TIGR03803 family)